MKMKRIAACAGATLALVLAFSVFSVSAETKALVDAKQAIDNMASQETLSLQAYKSRVDAINQVLVKQDEKQITATVTFQIPMTAEAIASLEQQHGVKAVCMEAHYRKDDEVYTAYIVEEEGIVPAEQLQTIGDENRLTLEGIVSANMVIDASDIQALTSDTAVYCVDTSAADTVEERSASPADKRRTFPKSLAWELLVENQTIS